MWFKAVSDYKVIDTVGEPDLSVDMKPLESLLLAIKNELHAAQVTLMVGESPILTQDDLSSIVKYRKA